MLLTHSWSYPTSLYATMTPCGTTQKHKGGLEGAEKAVVCPFETVSNGDVSTGDLMYSTIDIRPSACIDLRPHSLELTPEASSSAYISCQLCDCDTCQLAAVKWAVKWAVSVPKP